VKLVAKNKKYQVKLVAKNKKYQVKLVAKIQIKLFS